MAKQKLTNIHPTGVRLQPDLKAELERQARKVPRSLNAEIVDRLEKSLAPKLELPDYTDGELIDELIRRYGRERIYIRLGPAGE